MPGGTGTVSKKVQHGRRACLMTGLALAVPGLGATAPSAAAGVLRVVGPWEINSLEPASAGYLFTRMQVTETLTDADEAGCALPGLAARWDTSPDGLRWRFELRPGARFHDGGAVTAEHAAQMLRRAAARPGLLATAPVQQIAAEGGAVVLTLKAPFAALPALLSHSSTLVLAASSFDAQGSVVRIIGSGPYRIASLEPPQKFEVVAFEGFDGPRPAIRRASYLSASRAETRALMAEAGQADVAFGLDPASLERLRRDRRVQVEAVTIPRTMILKVNAGHRWLADARARQALSLALNRDGIARALLRDPGVAATQLFSPSMTGWHLPTLAPLRMDTAEALRLWAEMGWQRGADDIFQRGGERLRLSLRTFPDRPELPLVVAAVQEQLRQTGVEAKVAIGNSGDIPLRHRDGSLELALAARQYGLVPDPIGTLLQDFGPRGGDWGAMNWHSAALQQAIHELATLAPAAPTARRDALRARVVQVLHAELPVIPVAWFRQTAAVSPRVAGFSIDPLERSYRLDRLRWAAPGADTR
jgi:peptide/nickel transport system substrate-binding protein